MIDIFQNKVFLAGGGQTWDEAQLRDALGSIPVIIQCRYNDSLSCQEEEAGG